MASNINIGVYFDAVNRTSTTIGQVNREIDKVSEKASKVGSVWSRAFKSPVTLFALNDAIDRLSGTFGKVTEVGSFYNRQLADLSAITGIAGEQLDFLGEKARANAKAFGGDAGKSVEVYKLLLSQLGPDLAKTPELLSKMADNVSLLSKTMGNDTTAAAQVLTTAMNQYRVSIDDPIAAQKEMNAMMNAMSAAAKEGSAELPVQKAAIQNVGGAAKSAGLEFNEMLSALQVLDKAGKKGAEGGIALRNVLRIIGKGRFMESTLRDEMIGMGIDVDKLADKTVSFTDRLRMLKPVLKDNSLKTLLFGENLIGGEALVRSIERQEELTSMIKDTNTTTKQANTIMDTYGEKMSRMNAWVSDVSISLFEGTKEVLPYTAMVGDSLRIFTNVAQAGSALSKIMSFQSIWTGILTAKQWLLNIALGANPIGLIIVGVTALVGVIALVVAKYDEWGAALSILLGPLGMIIGIVRNVIVYWDYIVDAFQGEGIIGGLKAVGKVMIDALLYPVQQLLELIAKIPGLSIADSGAQKIAEWRKGLELPEEDVGKKTDGAIAESKKDDNKVVDNSTVNINLSGSATEKDAQLIVAELEAARNGGRLAYAGR